MGEGRILASGKQIKGIKLFVNLKIIAKVVFSYQMGEVHIPPALLIVKIAQPG